MFVPCKVAFSWFISTCIGPSLCSPGGRPRAAIASVTKTSPVRETKDYKISSFCESQRECGSQNKKVTYILVLEL